MSDDKRSEPSGPFLERWDEGLSSSRSADPEWKSAEGPIPPRHPEVDRAAAGLQRLFGAKLVACEAMRDLALELARPWAGRPLAGEVDRPVAALFARSMNTNWAAIELCRIGFASQAEMLERSLFEDMVDIHWVTVEPVVAVERMNKHFEHTKILFDEAARTLPDFFDVKTLPEQDQSNRDELDGLFGKFGQKSWTGLDTHKRVEAIEHLWKDEAGRRHLSFFRVIVNKGNNHQLHVTSHGLSMLVRAQSEEFISFYSGPSAERMETALFGSLWMTGQIVGLVLDHFEFPPEWRKRLSERFDEGTRAFEKPAASPEEANGGDRERS
jgi:Family of unknown function (DUF5677)